MSTAFDMRSRKAQDLVDVPHMFLGADAVGLQQSYLFAGRTSGLATSVTPTKHTPLMQQATEAMFRDPAESLGSMMDLEERIVPGLIGMAQMHPGSLFQAMPAPGPADGHGNVCSMGTECSGMNCHPAGQCTSHTVNHERVRLKYEAVFRRPQKRVRSLGKRHLYGCQCAPRSSSLLHRSDSTWHRRRSAFWFWIGNCALRHGRHVCA